MTAALSNDELELRGWVERCLGSRVDALERHLLPGSTSFACELLTVRTGERAVQLFWKDYGRNGLPRVNAEGPRREIEVYRGLLDAQVLGTPRLVGSLREPEDGHTWMLLELVPGKKLTERGFEDWLAPAAWLGRLQAHAAARGVAGSPPACLALHDVAHLRTVAEEAMRAVSSVSHTLMPDLLDALDGYEGAVEQLNDQPRTLVHGSFRPENILLDRSVAPVRVSAVDWEHAALGSALYDVAFLSAGFGREKAERLLGAHRASAAEHGLRLPEGEEAWELVTILRLHKLLRSLGRSQLWAYSRETIEHLITLAGRLSVELVGARVRRERARVALSNGHAKADQGPHPALRTWRELGRPERAASVERICGRFFGRKGRIVFRLRMDDPELASVVAKCSRRANLASERIAYSELLPALASSAPRYLGWNADANRGWLFIEDVGATRIELEDEAQRASAVRWLGELHASSARAGRDGRLPDLRAPWFRERLDEVRASVRAGLENPALLPIDQPRLEGVLSACDRLDSGWATIDGLCGAMPVVLVHGDFRPKNILVRVTEAGIRLLPIDWEFAGWGVPALDLGTLLRDSWSDSDLALYREVFPEGTRRASTEELFAWVSTGRILRALVSMQWESIGLAYTTGLEKPVRNLAVYARNLERAFQELALP